MLQASGLGAVRHALGRRVDHDKQAVAVCVTGSAARLQPRSLFLNVLQHNSDYCWDVIFVLAGGELRYSTAAHLTYMPSPFARHNSSRAMRLALESATRDLPDSIRLHVLDLVKDLVADEIDARLGGPLDRIREVVGEIQRQRRVLNMYNHQQLCAVAIEDLEMRQGHAFDWVVSTREDAYFMAPLNLTTLLARRTSCDIITKGCLAWGGLNMRFQLLPRRAGVRWLSSRFSFYHYLQSTNRSESNPESFEQAQARWLGLNSAPRCRASATELPVAVARHTYDGAFCIMGLELLEARCIACFQPSSSCRDISVEHCLHCFPTHTSFDREEFVRQHLCRDLGGVESHSRVRVDRKSVELAR